LTAKFLKQKMAIPAQNFFAFSDKKIYAIVPGIFPESFSVAVRLALASPISLVNAKIVE